MQADQPVFGKRWTVVLGGFLVSMMGGLSYSWGVFVEPLTTHFGWSKFIAMLPLSIFMIVFSISMLPAGKLQEKYGTRTLITIGAFLFLLANSLSAFLHVVNHPLWLIFTYGILGGTACGITYSCVAPSIRRWYPDYPGLAVSLGVMGFGLASFFFAPLKAHYIIPSFGIDGTFLIIAVVTYLVTLIASRLVVFPTDQWHMHIFGAMHLPDKTGMVRANLRPKQMVNTSLFWKMWLSFLFSIYGSLLIIGILPSFGHEVIGLSVGKASLPISLFALSNGLSRPLSGYISDKLGVPGVLGFIFFGQAIVFMLFPFAITSFITLMIASSLLGFGIGASLALYPVLTSECFGVEHMGINYGLLFTAYGFGAFAIQGGAYLRDITGSYTFPLIIAGILSLFSSVIILRIRIKYNLT